MSEENEGSRIEIPKCPRCGRMRAVEESGPIWKHLSSEELYELARGFRLVEFSRQSCPDCATAIWREKMR